MNSLHKCVVVLLGAFSASAYSQEDPIQRKIRTDSGYLVVVPGNVEAIAFLPKPDGSFRPSSTACENLPVRYEQGFSERDAGWLPRKRYEDQLMFWAIYHYGAVAGTSRGTPCQNGDLMVRAFQAALGELSDGLLKTSQARKLVDAVDSLVTSFSAWKAQRGLSPTAAPKEPTSEPPPSAGVVAPPPWPLSSSKQDRTVFGRVELGEPLTGAQLAGPWEKYPLTPGLEIRFITLPQPPEWTIPMRTTVGVAHLAVVTQERRAIQVKFVGFAKDCGLASKLFEERFGPPSFASGSGNSADWTKGDVAASIHCNLLSGAPPDIPFVFSYPVPRGETWYFASYTITLVPAFRMLDKTAADARQQQQNRIERSGPKL
jgi:hypothetical protein